MATATATRSQLKLQPLDDRVVIERDAAEDRTLGGIVLPDNAREKVNRGRVIAVGPGKWSDKGERMPLTVKPGDHVLTNKYGGDEIKLEDDTEYVILRESDILAVIED